MDSEVLTIKEVAEYLKVNERTIYRLAASNELPGFRVGNQAVMSSKILSVTLETRELEMSTS